MADILKAHRRQDPSYVQSKVLRITRLLTEAWAKAEPNHNVTLYPCSYEATFVDMAKAVVEYYEEDFIDQVKTAIAAMCECYHANCMHDKIRGLVNDQTKSMREELNHLRTRLGDTEFQLRAMTKACADAAAVTEKAIERLERVQPIIDAACNLVGDPNRVNYQWELEEAVLEWEKGKPS